MTDMTLKARLEFEMGQAKASLAALGSDLRKFGADAQKSMRDGSAAGQLLVTQFDMIRASVDPAYASMQKYRQIQADVAVLVGRGEVSLAAANIVLEQAAAKYNGVATSADRAKAALLAQAAATDAAEAASADAAREAAALQARFEALRGSVDQIYSAEMRFSQAQAIVDNALRAGITTEAQAAATMDLLAQKLDIAGLKAQKFAIDQTGAIKAAGTNAGLTGNVAAQFNDIGVMLAAGQNPFQLAIQQGTQLGQALQQAGGGINGAAAALKSGFMAMLSPTTLLTIAVIAGGAALVEWALDAGGAADAAKNAASANDAYGNTFTTLQGQFSTATSLHAEYVQAVLTGNKDLMQAIELEAEARQAAFNLDRIAQAEAKTAADKALVAQRARLEATVAEGMAMAANIAATKKEMADQEARGAIGGLGGTDFAAQLEIQQSSLADTMEVVTKQRAELDKTSAEYAVINAQVEVLNARMKANGDLIKIVKSGVVGTKDALTDAGTSGEVLYGALKKAWGAAIGLGHSAPGPGWMSGAIGQVDTLIGKLWEAAKAADAARTTNPDTPRLPGGVDALAAGDISLSQGHVTRRVPTVPDDNGSGGGGGGGGGGSTENATDGLTDLSAQAKKTLDDLDLALAVINEKVKDGLMSTAEAGTAVHDAKDKANNDLAALIAQIDRLGPAGQKAAADLRTHLGGVTTDLQAWVTDLSAAMSDGFVSPFKDLIKGTIDGETAVNRFGAAILDTMAQIAAKKAALNFVDPLINSIFGAIGGLFGGAGGAVTTSPIPPAKPFAQGGVPDGAPLSALRNQVLDKPTLFPMADGTGIMAEAGKEAIMPVGDGGVLAIVDGKETRVPLTRGAGGRLGVELPDGAVPVAPSEPVPFAKGGVPAIGSNAHMRAMLGLAQLPPMEPWREAASKMVPGGNLNARFSEMLAELDRGRPAYKEGGKGSGYDPMPGAPQINMAVNIHGVPEGHTARVEKGSNGDDQFLNVMIERIEGGMASRVRTGQSMIGSVIADTYGLSRKPR